MGLRSQFLGPDKIRVIFPFWDTIFHVNCKDGKMPTDCTEQGFQGSFIS